MKNTTTNLILTIDEALSILNTHKEKNKDRIHTLEGGIFWMGCNMDLSEVEKGLKKSAEIFIAGRQARNMSHGIGYFRKNKPTLFLATDDKKLKEICKQRKIK